MILKQIGRALHSAKQGQLLDIKTGRHNRLLAFLLSEQYQIATYIAGRNIKRGEYVIIDVNDTKVYSYSDKK